MESWLTRHFDLGFGSDRDPGHGAAVPDTSTGPASPVRLPLGGRNRARPILWPVLAWVSLACGIFLRQGLLLGSLTWQMQNLNLRAAAASLVVGLAVFPPAMRWLNSKRRRPGVEQILGAFSLGFLLNLAALASLSPTSLLNLGR